MTTKPRVTVLMGGAAGDGVASTGDIFCRTSSRSGLHVYAYNSYQSVIRGGHVYYQVQVGGDSRVLSHGDNPDIVIALNQDTMNRHAAQVREGGIVIFNADKIKTDGVKLASGVRALGLPVTELTQSFPGKNGVMQNTLALGALTHILGLNWAVFEESIRSIFGKKKVEVADANVKIAKAGFDFAQSKIEALGVSLKGDGKRRMLLTGNQAIAMGAVAGGCKFYSAYPMTPASSIMHWLAPRAPKYGMVMKQCEDEIAAINMAIGAGHAGVRSMTGTSGGGFALMTEAIGLAGMTETPVVIAEVQRGGPSTGLPTKTEQADLWQVLGASQGEYPRAVIAPITVSDAFYATTEALNLAEKFQCPILIVSDLLLSEHMETVDPETLTNKVPIERGEIVQSWTQNGNGEKFKRYKDTPSGVSPRVLPGTPELMYVAASDEHDEEGIVISDVYTDPAIRVKMMEKRMRKVDGLLKATQGPLVDGNPADAAMTLIGWGSTYQIIQEVVLALRQAGARVCHVQIRNIVPFHADELEAVLKASKKTVCIENNYTGQMASLIRQETGYKVHHKINKYDGEPFYFEPLLGQVKACLGANAPVRQVQLTA
jgi:2-oxoglutarate ferredoxin oxidoreductase subunit alpha